MGLRHTCESNKKRPSNNRPPLYGWHVHAAFMRLGTHPSCWPTPSPLMEASIKQLSISQMFHAVITFSCCQPTNSQVSESNTSPTRRLVMACPFPAPPTPWWKLRLGTQQIRSSKCAQVHAQHREACGPPSARVSPSDD